MTSACPSQVRTIHHAATHFGWSNTLQPALFIRPGETVALECVDASGSQINARSSASDIAELDFARVNPVTGPIWVDGAEPGEALCVDILDIHQSGVGWTAIIPGFGLLHEDFANPELKHWKYDVGGDRVAFSDLARVPLKPFCGTIGTAPAAPGLHSIVPPYATGGNLDLKDVTVGSSLYLPVETLGALLSIGDMHAAQGDGEVCGTAIESGMTVTVRVGLEKNLGLATPRLISSANALATGKRFVTTGIDNDLLRAASDSVRRMIDWLGSLHGMRAEDAYMLCSVAGDLRITEIVNMPRVVVSFALPIHIFD